MTSTERRPDAVTMAAHGEGRLQALCAAADFTGRESEIIEAYWLLSRSWGDRRVDQPPLLSYATADSTPLEFSVGFEDRPSALGIAVEAQADPATPIAYWDSAMELTRLLQARFDLPLSKLRLIQDLLRPGNATVQSPRSMAAYHVLAWSRAGAAAAKIYLWLGTPAGARTSVSERVFDALGLSTQWRNVTEALAPEDFVSYLSLDLSKGPAARTKVYVQHRGELSAERFARIARLADDFTPEEGEILARLAAQARERSRWAPHVSARDRMQWRSNQRRHWAAGTYLDLAATGSGPARSAVHQLALPPLVRDDAEAARLVHEIMAGFGIAEPSRAAYDRCLLALGDGPLSEQRYTHTFVSAKRRADGGNRVTVYFNPRMFSPHHGLTNGDLRASWRWHGRQAPNPGA